MPPRTQPTSFTAGRRIKLGGTTYARGAAIPNAVVKGLKHATALLSRRWIIPNVDVYRRRLVNRPERPTPTSLSVTERNKL
jgi:hypothetical protein